MTKSKDSKIELLRRDLIKGAGAFAGTLALGCGDTGPEGDYGFRGPLCEGGPSLSPQELLAPIEHIVVLMMENRSFDHYFGSLSLMEGREDIDGLTGNETNPGPNGEAVEPFHLDARRRLAHMPHTWERMHTMFGDGRNDGFCQAHFDENRAEHPEAFHEPMGFLTRDDIPVMYALADNYTLCDRWFCSVMGPTWPNRFYLHAATSGGRRNNRPKFFLDTIWGALRDRDLKGVNYFADLPWAAAALGKFRGFSRLSSFFEDAESGNLPEFSIIDPGFFFSTSDHPREFGGDSDHPDMGPNVNLGQVLIATLYAALANGPKWNNTLFMITYDESGGFFDHVVPGTLADERAEFRQLGFRVPGLVIGPHVRVGCANNNIFDHASVIATATQRFGLDPLNERVAATNDLSSCIHPDLLTDPQPGIVLPEIEIDEGGLIEKLEHVNTQPELWAAAENGEIPTELDYRSDLVGTTRALIRKARDYGLVRDAFKWG